MKALKSFFIVFCAVGTVISSSSTSFADRDQEDMKVLKEAASALEQTHSDLSANLTKIVERKDREQKEEMAGEKRTIKLYQDAAEALKETHADLAEGLAKLVTNLDLTEGLTKLANEESQEMRDYNEGKVKSEKQIEEQTLTNLLLLKEAAAALQESHPTLAEGLTKIASQKIKLMDEENTEEGARNEEKNN